MRIATDIIEADGILDNREMQFLHTLRENYAITPADTRAASGLTLADALDTLAGETDDVRDAFAADCESAAMSDGYCARSEALLMLALDVALGRGNMEGRVVSVPATATPYDDTQALYVESEFDKETNGQLNTCWLDASNTVRLMGFDLIYIPRVAVQYRSIPEEELHEMIALLYPDSNPERQQAVARRLRALTTEEVCKGLLAAKMGALEFAETPPALMLKVGDDIVDGRPIRNFVLIHLGSGIMADLQDIADRYARYYRNHRLVYMHADDGRFVVRGIHRMVLNLLMLQQGTRSRVVADTVRGQITFPDAGVKIEGIHLREKALYALFLLEAPNGGISFAGPTSAKHADRCRRRDEATRKKYARLYQAFGGNASKAPDITDPATRSPMLSLLKKQISKLGDALCDADQYIIMRGSLGTYNIRVAPTACCCTDMDDGSIHPIAEDERWQKIAKL